MELSSIAMRYSLSRFGMDLMDSLTDFTEVIALLGSSTGGSLYSSPSLSTSLFSSCYIIIICIQIVRIASATLQRARFLRLAEEIVVKLGGEIKNS